MSSPPPKFFAALREGKKPEQSLHPKPPGYWDDKLVAPQEEWTEEDWELARLLFQVIDEEIEAGKKVLRIL
jgi:hypothetical protein